MNALLAYLKIVNSGFLSLVFDLQARAIKVNISLFVSLLLPES